MNTVDELENRPSGFSKRDLAYLLYKRKGQIMAVLMVSALFTTVSVYVKSRSYEAFASIYVERGAPAGRRPDAPTRPAKRSSTSRRGTSAPELDGGRARVDRGVMRDMCSAPLRFVIVPATLVQDFGCRFRSTSRG